MALNNHMLMNRYIPLLAVIALIFSIIIIAVIGLNDNKPLSPVTPFPTDAGVSESAPTQSNTPSPSWQTFTSKEHQLTLEYPQEATVSATNDGAIRILVMGPTQQTGTEFYDGISISIDSGQLPNQLTFDEYVGSRRDTLTKDPIITSVSDITPISIGQHNGATFTFEGLGRHRFIFIPNNRGYLEIADSTQDPTNQGYKEQVNQILNSITLLND